MPTQGWVRFDPTPRGDGVNPTTYEEIETSLGFPLTNYLDVPDPAPLNEPFAPLPAPQIADDPLGFAPIGGGSAAQDGFKIPGWVASAIPWLGVLILAFGGIPVVKWWRRRRRLHKLRAGDISAAWHEIVARLDDLGTPPSPADTPAEVAAKVDPVMAPLANVYAHSLYGSVATMPDELVTTATTSMHQTEKRLATRHSRFARLRASYRLGTLLPKWWRRRRRG